MTYLIAHIGHTIKEREHVTWWKPNSCGYTYCIDKAGRYSEDEARSICEFVGCIAVRVQVVEPLALTTPYYRRSNGSLSKLYDGGPHRPVPNAAQVWRVLLSLRLPCSNKPDRPTPMPLSKCRSIYLDDQAKAEVAA